MANEQLRQISKEELDNILEQHKLWLETRFSDEAEGQCADLRGANLDFSCFPLWCGGLKVHIDDKQAIQLLYHLVRNVQFSKNTSDELKALLLQPQIIEKANEFHRVSECGKIELKEEVEED